MQTFTKDTSHFGVPTTLIVYQITSLEHNQNLSQDQQKLHVDSCVLQGILFAFFYDKNDIICTNFKHETKCI